jgi:hypothetical protein
MAVTLATYRNGNTTVTLYDDGTKTREWDGDANPEFPESIDLKITNWCDAGCSYCHEQSTKQGVRALRQTILRLVEGLPAGTEIAIGGGDPMSHPEFEDIVASLTNRGLVCNVTINGLHVFQHSARLAELTKSQWIHGVGISFNKDSLVRPSTVSRNNVVYHVIAGVQRVREVFRIDADLKLLVLGYKHYGRGLKFALNNDIVMNLREWQYWIGALMRTHHVSFDTLAIEQLRIRDWLTTDAWESLYMGADGQFSMYVDAVEDTYAVSSVSERRPTRSRTIPQLFKEL